jgi:nicotinamide N-methyltransferase
MALSNSGRVVFYSKHPSMLNVAVNTLKYIVELRDWSGLALPLIHARDSTIIIEDPGPFIIVCSSGTVRVRN